MVCIRSLLGITASVLCVCVCVCVCVRVCDTPRMSVLIAFFLTTLRYIMEGSASYVRWVSLHCVANFFFFF
jgi:hypothetical protein